MWIFGVLVIDFLGNVDVRSDKGEEDLFNLLVIVFIKWCIVW